MWQGAGTGIAHIASSCVSAVATVMAEDEQDPHCVQRQPRLLCARQRHLHLLLRGMHRACKACQAALHSDLSHGV